MPELDITPSSAVAPVAQPFAALRVRPFQPDVAQSWDQFVETHPRGTVFHLTAWKRVLEKTFGYQACYFYAERGGRIVGIVPLFSITNWIMGRCLLSAPFAVYGGICAEDIESEQALCHHLKSMALEQGVEYLELRNRKGGIQPEFLHNPRYSTFSMPLARDSGAIWKALPKDIRYMIRKAEKSCPVARHGHDRLEEFYRLLVVNLRRLGTPAFPRALFENLLQEYGDRVDLLVVYVDGRPVSAALSFVFRDVFQPYYVGAIPEARELAANNYLWWELIRFAAESGCHTFDFGRSKKGTGAYAFKKKFRPQIENLDYQVYLVRRKKAPNFSPTNPKFDLAARFWRCLPLQVTNWLGPRVVRWFP